MDTPVVKERRFTVAEAAAEIGMSEGALYAALYRGDLPHYRFGRRIYLSERHLIEFLRRSEHAEWESCR